MMKAKKIVVGKDEFREVVIEKPGEYLVVLAASGAEAEIKGAFVADGKANFEVSVVVHHQAPHTQAKTMLRAVGKDTAKLKLAGRIIVDKKCSNINSFLTERVLLLSPTAVAECIPDLEIESDDVRCSHAASITKIPEEHLFYLMSRGLDRSEAEKMIVEGFLSLDD